MIFGSYFVFTLNCNANYSCFYRSQPVTLPETDAKAYTNPTDSLIKVKQSLSENTIARCQTSSDNVLHKRRNANKNTKKRKNAKFFEAKKLSEKGVSDWKKKKSSAVAFSANDVEMLTQACEVLKSSPPSPVSPDTGFVVEPVVSGHVPLADLKQLALVPYNIAVNGPKHQINSSLLKLKNSICAKNDTSNQTNFNNENAAAAYRRPRSRLLQSCEVKSFDAFETKWPTANCSKFQLTGCRRDDLKRICSDLNQKSYLSFASSLPQLPQYRVKAITNEQSLLAADLSDSLTDLDVFSNSSELSDIFPELDLLSNCST